MMPSTAFRVVVVIFALVLQMAEHVSGNGQYTVIAPGTLHSAHDFKVSVAVHHTTEPCQLKIGITGPSYNETQTVDLPKPDEVHLLTFSLPELEKGEYNLTAEGVSGLEFKNTTKLNFGDFKPYVKLQTDKGKYKPGDIVNFRVLFLDENLRPAIPQKDAIIWIEDKLRNRIKELKNIAENVVSGVYTGNFELSEFASLGSWSINVKNGGTYPDSQTYFEVEKYVLPKYTVKMEATENVAVQDGDMQVVVRANYTYGKPVNGKVILVLTLNNPMYYRGQNDQTKDDNKDPPTIIKTADMVGGKAKFDLNVKEYEPYLPYKTSPAYLQITATVEEQFTDVKLNETGGTLLYPYRYHMNCVSYENCYQFHADKDQYMKFEVKYIDGTQLKDTKTVLKLICTEGIRKTYSWQNQEDQEKTTEAPKIENKKYIFDSRLNESGIATFKVNLPDLEDIENYVHYYDVELEYAGEQRQIYTTYPYREPKKSELPEVEQPKDWFKVEVQRKPDTWSLKLGEEATFTFNSSVPLKYFVYNIIGRGNILQSERIEFSDEPKIYNMTLTPTFLMSPYARLYAYYVDEEGEFHYAETSFHVDVELQNQINITAPAEVKPGQDVSLTIKTAPHSFVGLLAVDQSVLLLSRGNDIEANEFNWRLGRFDTHTPWQGGYSYYPGESSGVVTLTNANFFYNRTVPDNQPLSLHGLRKTAVAQNGSPGVAMDSAVGFAAGSGGGGGAAKTITVRKNFVETWIFANIENTETEVFNWTKTIPDTITTWVLSGFAIHPEKGLGVTNDKTNIKTFQPFFISIRLPYSVKRGEVIKVPALVFNYLNKDLDVEVTLENTDGEYEFLEVSNEVINDEKRVQNVRVPANDAAGVSFLLRPKIIGNIMLKFKAISPIAGDAIHKTLKVVPEGVTEYANRAYFVNLKDVPEYTESFELELPEKVVPDSQHIEFSVVGDLLGPVLNNLDGLVRMPTGCGEQTMSKLVPNYLVYTYLKKINKLTPTLETRIKRNLESGYQNMLHFRHEDGSFSSFGPHVSENQKPRNGSTWLTAYVLRSLNQMSDYINIDEKILDKASEYLLTKQADNGSFVEAGEYFYGSQRSHVSLTASALLPLLMRKTTTPSEVIEKGLKYLSANIEESKDLLPKALATYTLQKAEHATTNAHIAKLKEVAKTEDGRMWWSARTDQSDIIGYGFCRRWWCWPMSNDVEITSYMLLTLLETEKTEDILPILKWLVAQRNNYGGFASTQDTVIGLQALIKFAEKSGYEAAEMDIQLQSKGGKDKLETIKVGEENALLMQTIELPQKTTSIDFKAKGTGAALVQISYQYNIVEKDPKPSFKIETILKKDVPPSKLEMDVCVEFVGMDGKASNMAVLEISLPSGYTADEDSFEHIRDIDRVRLVETKNSDSVIVVYFESLIKDETKCLPIEAFKTFAVAMQKPAPIVLYDYYDTDKKATNYYEVESKLCDLCEDDGNDCRAKC